MLGHAIRSHDKSMGLSNFWDKQESCGVGHCLVSFPDPPPSVEGGSGAETSHC